MIAVAGLCYVCCRDVVQKGLPAGLRMKNNTIHFIVSLILFGSLLIYSYFYWPLFWWVMVFLFITGVFRPPVRLNDRWGLWLGFTLPVVLTFGFAISGV